MNLKQLIIFFSVTSVFFFLILIYNVYAQDAAAAPVIQTDNLYAKNSALPSNNSFKMNAIAKTDENIKPKYTPRPKPAGAPKIIKSEAEAEYLYAKAEK